MRFRGIKLTKKGICALVVYALLMILFVFYEINCNASLLTVLVTSVSAYLFPCAVVDTLFAQ